VRKSGMRLALLSVSLIIIGLFSTERVRGTDAGRIPPIYDQLLSELANYVAMQDALQRNDTASVHSILVNSIEDRFIKVVDRRRLPGAEEVERLLCSVTARVRKLQAEGLVLTKERERGLREGDLQRMNDYLRNECVATRSQP
jgi:hypothetical protein